ncbi:hypothetical protein [Streptomyces wuyuanensis]|uniref:Uncharacterized protein n=1 Tax=Streptomyces wuyuanensis TaxID=1196353 RepID=A0A1G9N6H5_9ACTN|nr:hypothetical protein [Streptomyces wuyuanensis]SDL81727.1 hypothetical protein SAMN05444921_101485 [Streptomyces wuyuanensis]
MPPRGGAAPLRYVTGALGVVMMAVGAALVLSNRDAPGVLVWLGGALVLHDAVLAPLVLGVGLLVAGLPARGVVRGALVVGGSLVLVTLPLLLRPGAPPNPSALPLPYARNLVIVLGAVAGAACLVLLVRWLRRRPRYTEDDGRRGRQAPRR